MSCYRFFNEITIQLAQAKSGNQFQFRSDLELYERDVESIMAHVFGDDDDDYEDTL